MLGSKALNSLFESIVKNNLLFVLPQQRSEVISAEKFLIGSPYLNPKKKNKKTSEKLTQQRAKGIFLSSVEEELKHTRTKSENIFQKKRALL